MGQGLYLLTARLTGNANQEGLASRNSVQKSCQSRHMDCFFKKTARHVSSRGRVQIKPRCTFPSRSAVKGRGCFGQGEKEERGPRSYTSRAALVAREVRGDLLGNLRLFIREGEKTVESN